MTCPFFNGKTIFISGASSGIGEALAKALANEQANLILTGRNLGKLQLLKSELTAKRNIAVHIFRADLSAEEERQGLIEDLRRQDLSVDILINNAGFGVQGPFESYDFETYKALINVNILSVIKFTLAFLPDIIRNKGGIINIASTAAFQPLPFFSVYSATKSFMLNFSEALWGEYSKKGLHVLTVCPGHTQTSFHSRAKVPVSRIFGLVSADFVARSIVDAYRKRKMTLTIGFLNSILANINRLFSRKTVVNISRGIFAP